jgi:acetyl esterase/lipase
MKLRPLALTFLIICALQCAALTKVFAEAPAEAAYPKTTYTYKRIGSLNVQLDVYRTADNAVRPVAIWLHGGALIMGSRHDPLSPVAVSLLKAGYAVVSIDYRLAPETKLPDIIADVEDAYQFVRTKGPSLFMVRTDKIAVLGESAGAFLALTLGFKALPHPAVLVSLYGYGDLIGSWYSEPSDYYRTHVQLVSESEAKSVVGQEAIADASLSTQHRYLFYFYTRQNGLWPIQVAGWDPRADARKFMPFMPIKNITNSYPPTMLIQGDADEDVPYEQSVMMANELQVHGVEHEFITIKNAGHFLRGGDPADIAKAYEEAVQFVIRHMN